MQRKSKVWQHLCSGQTLFFFSLWPFRPPQYTFQFFPVFSETNTSKIFSRKKCHVCWKSKLPGTCRTQAPTMKEAEQFCCRFVQATNNNNRSPKEFPAWKVLCEVHCLIIGYLKAVWSSLNGRCCVKCIAWSLAPQGRLEFPEWKVLCKVHCLIIGYLKAVWSSLNGRWCVKCTAWSLVNSRQSGVPWMEGVVQSARIERRSGPRQEHRGALLCVHCGLKQVHCVLSIGSWTDTKAQCAEARMSQSEHFPPEWPGAETQVSNSQIISQKKSRKIYSSCFVVLRHSAVNLLAFVCAHWLLVQRSQMASLMTHPWPVGRCT